MTFSQLVALSTVLVCVTGGCAKASAPPNGTGLGVFELSSDSTITPPANATDAQLQAWASRYIVEGKYIKISPYLHADPANRVFLYDPASVETLPDGHVTAWFRLELIRPVEKQGVAVRSVHKKMEIDCSDLRFKEISIESFYGANLVHRAPDFKFPDTWGKPESESSPQGMAARRVCNDAKARK